MRHKRQNNHNCLFLAVPETLPTETETGKPGEVPREAVADVDPARDAAHHPAAPDELRLLRRARPDHHILRNPLRPPERRPRFPAPRQPAQGDPGHNRQDASRRLRGTTFPSRFSQNLPNLNNTRSFHKNKYNYVLLKNLQ